MLHTRGKRVVAEATIPDALFRDVMNSNSELMYRARQVSNLGGFMSGVNNNGAHSANGITAMFIATGQDAANVAESSAAFVYAELRENGDYYYSVTIPSLIVATYGGGTGLATQRECLELLGCYGHGQGAQVHRDRRGDRAVRRAVAGLGDRRGGVGPRARPAGAQPAFVRVLCGRGSAAGERQLRLGGEVVNGRVSSTDRPRRRILPRNPGTSRVSRIDLAASRIGRRNSSSPPTQPQLTSAGATPPASGQARAAAPTAAARTAAGARPEPAIGAVSASSSSSPPWPVARIAASPAWASAR